MKYLEKRERVNGKAVWICNPSASVKRALKIGSKTFKLRSEAEKYCKTVALQFDVHRRQVDNQLHIDQETVRGLVNFYKTTREWSKLKENSQIFYDLCFRSAFETYLGKSNAAFGELIASNIKATQADRLFLQIEKDFSTHRAVHATKVLRKAYNVGIRNDKVTFNPFAKMQKTQLDTRKVVWTEGDVFKLIETADKMGFPSIGTLALLNYDLCGRPGDMMKLQWDGVDPEGNINKYEDGTFYYTQEKTGTHMEVPASPRLITRLKGTKWADKDQKRYIVICETTGEPYSKDLRVKYFARIRKAAGIPTHLQLRDLRRTGATEMADNGCTEDELRAVGGWQSREILATYVRPTRKMANNAQSKRFA